MQGNLGLSPENLAFYPQIPSILRCQSMYKRTHIRQLALNDFNQPIGLTMDPKNRWVRLAAMIPWEKYEHKYARIFMGSKVGNVAKPFRMALGSLIIQQKLNFPDRELVEEITENPYLQYFIGLPGYQQTRPFDPSLMTLFRKRISLDVTQVINEAVLRQYEKPEHDDGDDDHKDGRSSAGGTGTADGAECKKTEGGTQGEAADEVVKRIGADNAGTLILDATCAPSNIRFPQDFSLLNEAREKLEKIIRRFHQEHHLKLPRMYSRTARKSYLAIAKSKKRSAQKIRELIRYLLNCIRRNIGYLKDFKARKFSFLSNEIKLITTIQQLYTQQLEMYRKRTHRVADRIVSIQQPWIRPIVRGKVDKPVEFGTKFDLSLDEFGMGRIEKISFDAYNESGTLQAACERYRERTGRYPERILVDQIYRNRDNRKYCKERGIRMSGPKLGRPYSRTLTREQREVEYRDNTDRIEVERSFSLSKRCFSLGLIRTKTEITTFGAIGLSILTTNLFRILARAGHYIFVFLKILFLPDIPREEREIVYWAHAC